MPTSPMPAQAQKLFCYIPDACIDLRDDVSAQVRTQLKEALSLNLEPSGIPKNHTRQAVNIMDGADLVAVRKLSAQINLAPGRVIGGLLYALLLHKKPEKVASIETRGLRRAQEDCLIEAAPMLKAGKLVLVEAGTGSGKSRIIAHAAAFALSLRKSGLPALRNFTSSSDVPEASSEMGGDQAADKKTRSFSTPEFLLRHAQKAIDARTVFFDQHGGQPNVALICAPSVENIVHLLKEWRIVRPTLDPDGLLSVAIVLGRAQYVSASKLQLLLDNAEPDDGGMDPIRQWLDGGMKEHFTDSTRALAQDAPCVSGLKDDLEWLCKGTSLNASDAELDESSPKEEIGAYQALRHAASLADMVFTTTAMLCMDSMRLADSKQPRLLPYPAALFVDEAHTLESIQASMAAKSFSFVRLRAELRSCDWSSIGKKGACEDVLRALKVAAEKLERVPDGTPLPIDRCDDPLAQFHWRGAQDSLRDLGMAIEVFAKVSDKRSGNLSGTMRRALKYAEDARYTLGIIKEGYRGFMNQSPRRRQISFTMGPKSVQRHLLARWATTPMGMLLSGTLAHIGSGGGDYSAIKAELSIPSIRCSETRSMHPSWLHSTPVIMQPGRENFHHFMPPKITNNADADEAEMRAWLHNCTRVIDLAATSAKGGTLVLVTSFDKIDGFWRTIEKGHPHLVNRIIAQKRHGRFSQTADHFRKEAIAGNRPIWLATGQAWTGLDLTHREVDASEDFLLTDLVIPHCPFGLDRTTTHQARLDRVGFRTEVIGVQRRLRQGMGRLVRREGLQHRRIWLLDGRLKHPAAGYTRDLNLFLTRYLHRKSFN